eukprot:3537321-Prymnesium_polylepis.3
MVHAADSSAASQLHPSRSAHRKERWKQQRPFPAGKVAGNGVRCGPPSYAGTRHANMARVR